MDASSLAARRAARSAGRRSGAGGGAAESRRCSPLVAGAAADAAPHALHHRNGASAGHAAQSRITRLSATPQEARIFSGQNGRAPHHGVQALGGGVSSASAAGATQGADKKASSVVGLETEDVLPATHPWFALDTVWEANEKLALQTGTMPALLTPSWKVLLLSDGSVTRHLQLLTDISVEVGMIDETHVGTPYGTPTGTERIRGPLLQRQVYLKRSGGEALAYAASWWSAEDMKEYMKDGDKPIWQNLAARRAELYREVQRVYLGNNEELEKEFGFKGPFWGRHYTFWHNGRPLTLIYEVFSPRLEKWLGSSHPEGFDSLWSS